MFPDFNLYSMTLLILVLQGYLFAFLLIGRFAKDRKLSDLFLGLILIVTCYRTTSYVIGFLGWYDVNNTTKVNYALLDTALIIGPLIYFYIRSLCQPHFSFEKKHLMHFVPFLGNVLLALFVFVYDSQQDGFNNVQNGVLYLKIFMENGFWLSILSTVFEAIYYFFSVKLFIQYREQIVQLFSNTFKIELNWIRNFLVIYVGLFLLSNLLFKVVNRFVDLTWTDSWWWFFANALAVFFVGIRGYFSTSESIEKIEAESLKTGVIEPQLGEDYGSLSNDLVHIMSETKPYLNADLTLSDLASELEVGQNKLSAYINRELGKNFNDFINEYRVEAVKETLNSPEKSHLSILGIALDCGFSSKATFNRVFKKFAGVPPSQYTSGESTASSTRIS